MRALLVGMLLMVLVGSAVAQASVVGEWSGKLTLMAKAGTKESADDKSIRESLQSMFSKMKVQLTLAADKTFRLKVDMSPEKSELLTGVWSASGKKLTLTTKLQDGKPPKKKEPQVYTIDKDGSFWTIFDGEAKVTFARKTG